MSGLEKPIVRTITYFTRTISSTSQLEEEIQRGVNVVTIVENCLVERGFSIFTKRLSFTGLPRELAYRLIDVLPKGFLASIGYSRSLSKEDIVELTLQGLFVPILHSSEPSYEKALEYSTLIHTVSSRSPDAATRLAIGFHDEKFQTPYFPDSSSRGFEAIGLAFIYPKSIIHRLNEGLSLEEAFKHVYSEILSTVAVVKECIGIRILVDYSLSPWMENSVAEIYERLGYSIASSSALYFTWLLNKFIDEYSDREVRIGFNEVMLPYAEDNLLMEYGAKGLLRVRDLLALSSTCVAGVDMIVTPESRELLAGVIASAMAISYVKKRPMSLRAIPVQAKPGDIINLGRFGRVPVIDY